MDTLDVPDGRWYIAIAVLLLFSAFFSASETALSTVNRLRLRRRAEEPADKNAKAALGLVEQRDKTLFSVSVGNNLVKIAAASIATGIAITRLGGKGAAVATAAVTLLVLTFGEILPKTIAGDNNEKAALAIARPLRVVIVVLSPLTALFAGLKKLLRRGLPAPVKAPTITEEELIHMVESIGEEGVLEEQESDLVQSALQFDEIAIHEILTPRVNIVALDVETPVEEVRDKIVEEGYARIPVYEGNIDNIIGILYSREFLNEYVSGHKIELRAMVSEPLFVPRRMRLSRLLATFKAKKVNIAVVTDDYGGTLGIATMEDVVEELVGDIWDEDDEIPQGLVRLDSSTVEAAGDYDLDEMFEALGVTGPDAESEYATVNGWALDLFGHIPRVEEFVGSGRFVLVVLEMNGHHIKRLRVSLRPA